MAKQARILIAEDDKDIRESYRRLAKLCIENLVDNEIPRKTN